MPCHTKYYPLTITPSNLIATTQQSKAQQSTSYHHSYPRQRNGLAYPKLTMYLGSLLPYLTQPVLTQKHQTPTHTCSTNRDTPTPSYKVRIDSGRISGDYTHGMTLTARRRQSGKYVVAGMTMVDW